MNASTIVAALTEEPFLGYARDFRLGSHDFWRAVAPHSAAMQKGMTALHRT